MNIINVIATTWPPHIWWLRPCGKGTKRRRKGCGNTVCSVCRNKEVHSGIANLPRNAQVYTMYYYTYMYMHAIAMCMNCVHCAYRLVHIPYNAFLMLSYWKGMDHHILDRM